VCINIVLDLIHRPYLDSGLIWALVDILVDVLDSPDGRTDLQVDVAAILGEQIGVVGHHITVGVDMHLGLTEPLGAVVLLVGILGHAGGFDMVWSTTGTMQHVLGDSLMQLGMEIWVRKGGRDNAVYMLSIADLVRPLQEDEQMHVRQTPLLELHSVDISSQLSKQSIPDLLQQSLLLLLEHMCHNVRAISSSLGSAILKLEQSLLDLRPIGVGSHGQEDVRLSPIATDGHGVLEELVHVARTALVGGGEDNALTLLC
jgi:hypothetical protein